MALDVCLGRDDTTAKNKRTEKKGPGVLRVRGEAGLGVTSPLTHLRRQRVTIR